LSWAAAGWLDPHTCLQILKIYKEAINWAQPHLLCRCSQHHTTSPSQGCVLGAASGMGKARGTHIPRTGEWSEEPPSAGVQVTGQLVVISF